MSEEPSSSTCKSTSGATPTSQPIQLRVLAASTGVCFPISIPPNELTVTNIRRHLAGAVPPQDQILLLGPPYKVPKDSTLRSEEVLASLRLGDIEDDLTFKTVVGADPDNSPTTRPRRSILTTTERSGARRLFLFSKQALSDAAPDPPACVLEPRSLTLPTSPDPSPLFLSSNDLSSNSCTSLDQSSPLNQALSVYERRFMLHLCRGRVLADGADLRLQAIRTCTSEQVVMARALRAAVSNLSDHRSSAARTRTEFTATFQAKTTAHFSLLSRFDSHLLKPLSEISLHPALVAMARESGRMMETLLDTVPVEREKAWAMQCQNSHQRLLTLFSELDAGFGQMLGTRESREQEAKEDLAAEEEIDQLIQEANGSTGSTNTSIVAIRDLQAQRLNRLTKDHGEAVRVVMNAISENSGDAQAAFSILERMSKASANTLPAMERDDEVVEQFMMRVGEAKTKCMIRMKNRLRQISIAQSSIQRILSHVAVVKDALAVQSENMAHLEHVAELPASYREFLDEVRRRRAYGSAVASSSTAMFEQLATMRADEIKARERFLRGPGRHLMPAFFEMFVPTLATPPPLFAPQLPAMLEMDTLPDFGIMQDNFIPGEVGGTLSSMESGINDSAVPVNIALAVPGDSGISSTTKSQSPRQSQAKNTDAINEKSSIDSLLSNSLDSNVNALTIKNRAQQQPHSFSVSADDNDIIMETASNENDGALAKTEAECKTLAYENTVFRQALERLGKSPRSCLDDAQEKDAEYHESINVVGLGSATLQAEFEKTRKELETVKARLQQANAAIAEINKDEGAGKICDKISHSSFKVGDVGLFMPTGRASGGNRTYLAFHSNCPHRYLSTDSIDGTPDYVLGRIIYQEELAAGAVGTDANPYGLHVGTTFWVLTVEVLNFS